MRAFNFAGNAVEFIGKMPVFKAKNEDFFKNWSPEMTYVLGFFAADGNMIKNKRGAHFIAFYSTDRDILEKIKFCLGSDHKIYIRKKNLQNKNWKKAYQIQIGSKEIFKDLLRLGFMPNKSLILKMPKIPRALAPHFLRGYFDGDGHVSASEYQKKDRKHKSKIIITGLTSGSKKFLKGLWGVLKKYAVVKGGTLFYAQGHRLCFSSNDSFGLYNFMYKDAGKLYLSRKKVIFEHYFKNLLRA
ncbi:MAG: hypothetical protein UW79_C0001G0010 [Candidatus Yanofskybacteria bacterium GW2011_GWA2_44_9]|nr:MAG: hypothetical protein UW79_C0001G0010 [Candidatus Yanofskybacteria bacterium GW2011_GWA2_44_9]OGN04018.1 MAG: hypothetical protein A2659_00185 [Candidatus Yanofskybacteria bacterium RIFCSPHIGHO2_01_FULL_44_24]